MIAARRSRTSGSISRRARSRRPPATRAIAVASASPSSGASHAEPLAHGALGEPPERDELAARADRLGERAELVGDEHDRGVERRLLEILEQRVGGVVVEQVRPEQEVHPAVGLERAQVEVVVELADDVDPDHVPERLDDPQVGVGALDDPARVAELRAREREGGRRLADARRAVEEEGVRVAVAERRGQQPLRLVLLRNRCEAAPWISSAICSAGRRAVDRSRYRSGSRAASCR